MFENGTHADASIIGMPMIVYPYSYRSAYGYFDSPENCHLPSLVTTVVNFVLCS
jgi:hypothetical protein